MSDKNLYDILGVPTNATAMAIRKAYLLRIKAMHPDRFDQRIQADEWTFANQFLQELNRANSVLRDPEQRRIYDDSILGGRASPRSSNSTSHAQNGPPVRSQSWSPTVQKLINARGEWDRLYEVSNILKEAKIELPEFFDSSLGASICRESDPHKLLRRLAEEVFRLSKGRLPVSLQPFYPGERR